MSPSPAVSVPTVAQLKLARFIAEHSPNEVYRRCGVRPPTAKLLAAGVSRPNAATVDRLRELNIQPLDWFTSAVTVSTSVPSTPTPVAG